MKNPKISEGKNGRINKEGKQGDTEENVDEQQSNRQSIKRRLKRYLAWLLFLRFRSTRDNRGTPLILCTKQSDDIQTKKKKRKTTTRN
uniref:Uncharacterized protein n=1 Tax=Nelumbo nucifera TaxID=4432 RepID=A0A822XT38_NELNU|nr:TPA_asm: hypothetical protein HUJ06_024960 [Nelumbo nucifera]